MKTFLPKSGLLTFVFLITNLFFASGAFAQATVITDKDDYAPGEYVIITGTGWMPGEAVSFHFDEDPKPATCLLSHDITTVADSSGNIYNNEFLIKDNHLGVAFVLTATGKESGRIATTEFTDANISFNTSGLVNGTVVSVTVSYTNEAGISVPNQVLNITAPSSSIAIPVLKNTTLTYTFSNLLGYTGPAANSTFTQGNNNAASTITGVYVGQGGSGGLTVTAVACAQGGAYTITYTPTSGADLTETHNTPFSVTAKKNTSYSITAIASNVNGNSYTGITPVTGTTPNSNDYLETVTLAYSDNTSPIVVSNGSSTVDCIVSAVAPTIPNATDNCNGAINGVFVSVVDNPSSLTCEGTRVYTYSYTDAASHVSYWVYTYTIESEDFATNFPANTGSTIACAALLAEPTVPEVKDNCENVLTASAAVISDSPSCEGDVTYTYTFTDCEGNTHDWVYTYTIERLDFTMPIDAGSTIACAASLAEPTVPEVTDNCGNALTASAAVISSSPSCEGDVTYTYTFTDCEGNTHDWVYTYTIERLDFTMPIDAGSTIACAASLAEPTVPEVTDNCANALTASAAVISSSPSCEGDVTYTYTFTDCEGNTHDWVYTYTIERLDFTMPIDAGSTIACAASLAEPTVPEVKDNCGNVLTPAAVVISATPACEGDATYTYKFTDCEGNTHDWVYTYTIESEDFIMPANTGSTIACIDDAILPSHPTITDNCGSFIIPSGPIVSTNFISCSGTKAYTWQYIDCEGNTHNWIYTYIIEDKIDPIISCPSESLLTREVNSINCGYKVVSNEFNATATDNCVNPALRWIVSGATTINGSGTMADQILNKGDNVIKWIATDDCDNTSSCSFTVTVTSPLVATSTTDNEQLYFGLSTDQMATITTVPTGGTGPYTIEYTMSRPMICNKDGGSETWTGDANTLSNVGNVCPSTTPVSTSNAILSYSIVIKLMADATITAKVTDKFGCVDYSTVKILAEDIRCFAGKNGNAKVKMCHQTGSPKNPCIDICVDESAVASHLAHGDFLGNCKPGCVNPAAVSRPVVIGKEEIIEIPAFNVIAYPNPSNHQFTLAVQGGSDEQVEVVVYDMLARVVRRIAKPNAKDIQFGEELPSGEYLLLVRQGENQKAINVIKK